MGCSIAFLFAEFVVTEADVSLSAELTDSPASLAVDADSRELNFDPCIAFITALLASSRRDVCGERRNVSHLEDRSGRTVHRLLDTCTGQAQAISLRWFA